MRIWSILLIKSDLKWCIHLSRSLYLYIVIGLDLITKFDFPQWQCISSFVFYISPQFKEVTIYHLQRLWHANIGRLPLRALVPVPLWDLHVFWGWDQLVSPKLVFVDFRILFSISILLSIVVRLEPKVTDIFLLSNPLKENKTTEQSTSLRHLNQRLLCPLFICKDRVTSIICKL